MVRIPDYNAYRLQNIGATPEDYVQVVAQGGAIDRPLTPILRVGLTLKGVIKNYMQDQESHNVGAVPEWRM